MPLAKYVSNNHQVNKTLLARGLINEIPESCKILGMTLDLELDSFILNLPNFNVTDPTLTSVLSDHSTIWDIVGFIEPVRVLCKVFINKLHAKKLNWKSKLDKDQITEWKSIV